MVLGTIVSSTVARRVYVPARGKSEKATLPSGHIMSLVGGGVTIAAAAAGSGFMSDSVEMEVMAKCSRKERR